MSADTRNAALVCAVLGLFSHVSDRESRYSAANREEEDERTSSLLLRRAIAPRTRRSTLCV